MAASSQTATRGGRAIVFVPGRRRTGGAKRAAIKPSALRRVVRIVWVSPRHAAFALAAGLACGALASRLDSTVQPPFAAILGVAAVYPALVAVWRRVPRPVWH